MSDKHNPIEEAPSPAKPLAGKTVLLVEDESFIAELLVNWFGRLGAQTLWANSGEEGVRMLKENCASVCLVIADFRLPDMDGGDMCNQMRALKPRLPVLLSSGRYQREAAESLSRSGPTGFIQKPYPLDEVLTKLKTLIAAA